jgi:hypothetical protein
MKELDTTDNNVAKNSSDNNINNALEQSIMMEETNKRVLPIQFISHEKAKELNQNFNTQRSPLHKTAKGSDDANAIWYSLESLESYIDYIKTEGEQKGYQVDGIRFYFGVYSDTEIVGKAGHTTLFLSPTGKPKERELLSLPDTIRPNSKISRDITELRPMNFGGMGNPPKMEYGKQE